MGRQVIYRSIQARQICPDDICSILDIHPPPGYQACCEGGLECPNANGYFYVEHGMNLFVWLDWISPATPSEARFQDDDQKDDDDTSSADPDPDDHAEPTDIETREPPPDRHADRSRSPHAPRRHEVGGCVATACSRPRGAASSTRPGDNWKMDGATHSKAKAR